MKDEDIILACELCLNAGESCPYNCPYYEYSGLSCQYALSEDAFDLINRQQAMIDDLAEDIEYWMQRASNDKEKAIKDFAEKLKQRVKDVSFNTTVRNDLYTYIEDVVKEMTEIRGV